MIECTKYGREKGPCCNCNFESGLDSTRSYIFGDKYVSNRSKISINSDNNVQKIDKIMDGKIGEVNSLYDDTINVANDDLERNEIRNSMLNHDMQKLKNVSMANDTIYKEKLQNLANRIDELEQENLELLKAKNIRESEISVISRQGKHVYKDIEELKKRHSDEINLLNELHNEKLAALRNDLSAKLENMDIECRDNIKNILYYQEDIIKKIALENNQAYEEFTEITNKLFDEKNLEYQNLQNIINNNDFFLSPKAKSYTDTNNNEKEENHSVLFETTLPAYESECQNKKCLAIKEQNITLKQKLVTMENYKNKCLKCIRGQYLDILKDINISKPAFNLTWMKKNNELNLSVSDDTDVDIQNLRNEVHSLKEKYKQSNIQNLRNDISRLDENYKKINNVLKNISKAESLQY